MTYRSSGSYTRNTTPPRRGVHHSLARKLGIGVEWAVGILSVLAIVGGLFAWFIQYQYGSEHTATFKIETVTSNASGSTGTGHQYLIYTDEGHVLANQDALFHGKFDSSNVQAWLYARQGQTVSCPVFGYRVFIFSSYEDVLDGCKVASAGAAVNY